MTYILADSATARSIECICRPQVCTIQVKVGTSVQPFDEIVAIGELWSRGENITSISAQLEISRGAAAKGIEAYKDMLKSLARDNINIAEKVTVVMEEVDQHYKMIVREAWKNKESAENQNSLSQVTASLKLIADIQKARASMFQSAGLNGNAELMAEMEETQRNQEIIIEILKDVAEKYPEASRFIRERLSDILNEAQVIQVDES